MERLHLEISALKLQKILGNICFSEQIFYKKQPLGSPENRKEKKGLIM